MAPTVRPPATGWDALPVHPSAGTVLWLCSAEASFAVGHAMVVDGGQTT